MGYYTWTDAKRRPIKKANGDFRAADVIGYDCFAKIVCPDGAEYKEQSYDGYGMFGDVDAYDVVVDQNKQFLPQIFERLQNENPNGFWGQELADVATCYGKGDEQGFEKALAALCVASPRYLFNIREEWKRTVGITISCADEHNDALPYPLKITRSKRKIAYADLVPSYSTQ